MKTLVLTLDLVGTFVFALSGATAGARRRLDIFGVLVLSFVAANSGGIVRDLLIGATPPAAISDWRYLAVSLMAGVVIFFWYPVINRLQSPVLFFDAVGLALFCVAGAQKALVFGLTPLMAALLGMLTGIGGGIARDVLAFALAGIPYESDVAEHDRQHAGEDEDEQLRADRRKGSTAKQGQEGIRVGAATGCRKHAW
ncbi:MAG TPA: hypothetical protein DCX52_00355 [Massilia sp.]|nr:hypothetical protein [Massilia sp.]